MEQASIMEGYAEYGKHAEPEEKKGFFTKAPEPSASFSPDMTDQMRNLSRRLRVLEERYANQRKNMQVMEHNMLNDSKKLQTQMHSLQTDFDELKKQIYDLKQKFDLIAADLADTAKREDVIVLEKYINLWEPLNFVTRNEVERIVEFVLENKKNMKVAPFKQQSISLGQNALTRG